jgi:hypothetical protein
MTGAAEVVAIPAVVEGIGVEDDVDGTVVGDVVCAVVSGGVTGCVVLTYPAVVLVVEGSTVRVSAQTTSPATSNAPIVRKISVPRAEVS